MKDTLLIASLTQKLTATPGVIQLFRLVNSAPEMVRLTRMCRPAMTREIAERLIAAADEREIAAVADEHQTYVHKMARQPAAAFSKAEWMATLCCRC